MQVKNTRAMAAVLGLGVLAGASWEVGAADDGGLLGRLFRPNPPAANPYARSRPTATPAQSRPATPAATPFPEPGDPGASDLPATPPVSSSGPANRIAPRPRQSAAVTSADPVLTRIAVGRSSDGTQFGMLMQIYADGTVIDSEGVHRLRPGDLRPLGEVIQSGELSRLRGHCGAPAIDFLEYVQITMYERRMGRLTAQTFSYSGNPQGCDPALGKLHHAIENLQLKLSRPAGSAAPAGATGPAPAASPAPRAPAPEPIPLSPAGGTR